MNRNRLGLLVGVALLAAARARAGTADSSGVSAHGFLLLDSAVRLSDKTPAGSSAKDFLLGEALGRVELAIEPPGSDAAGTLKLDVSHDAVTGGTDVELREGALDWRKGRLDLRAGRQVLTWGLGDLVFINDLFPKDYESFFLGRPIEYLKVPSDALRTSLALKGAAVDVVAIPFFSADRLPARDRFVLGFDPFASANTSQTMQPAASWANTELAARVHGSTGSTELALYAFRGFFHSGSLRGDPAAAPATVMRFFPRLSVYGASVQRSALQGILSVEAGYYDSRDDRQGLDPLIPNSSARWLVGYQREVSTDFTIGLQHVSELMMDHDRYRSALPAGFPEVSRYRQTFTVRATRLLDRQTWKLSVFAFFGFTENDVMLIPEAEQKVSDQLSVAVGANLFGGDNRATTFGTLADSSNVYVRARLGF
ncbi:MAG: hypothetical protein HY303_18650 [Candidatus Wallbacteria bacterium]|nr:hypothetical protein [Candidatus Wallbacteria bacterium]